MVRRTRTLDQTLLRSSHPKVTLIEVDDLANFALESFLTRADTLGVACTQGSQGMLTHIAFATPTRVLCVCMPSLDLTFRVMAAKQARAALAAQRTPGREALHKLLQSQGHRKLAFDMDKLAMALYHDFALTIAKGVDILSASCSKDRRDILAVVKMLGGENAVHKRAIRDTFLGRGFQDGGVTNVALRAWAACKVHLRPEMTRELMSIAPIDTTIIPQRVRLPYVSTISKLRSACSTSSGWRNSPGSPGSCMT